MQICVRSIKKTLVSPIVCICFHFLSALFPNTVHVLKTLPTLQKGALVQRRSSCRSRPRGHRHRRCFAGSGRLQCRARGRSFRGLMYIYIYIYIYMFFRRFGRAGRDAAVQHAFACRSPGGAPRCLAPASRRLAPYIHMYITMYTSRCTHAYTHT